MPILIFLIFIFGVVFFVLTKNMKSQKLMKMSFWLIISYTFLLLIHFFSGIKYNSGNMIRILPFFLSCILLMILGEAVGNYLKIRNPLKRINIKHTHIAYLSIAGGLLFVTDIVRLNSVSFGSRIQDYEISIIGVVGNILSSLGIISWLSSLYRYILKGEKIALLPILSILSYVAGGILTAGRQAIILTIIASFIMCLWGIKQKRELGVTKPPIQPIHKKRPLGLIILIGIFIGYFLFISSVRSGIHDINNKISMLQNVFNAKVSESTLAVVDKIEPFSDIYIEALFYYSHELPRLDLLYQYYDYPPVMGLSQLSYVERRIQWLTGNQGEKSWMKVEEAISKKGKFFSHTWGTFISNFIIDFGRFGTLIACFISGFIFGTVYQSFKKNGTQERMIRQCIMLAGIVFSIQFSPFSELIWAFPLLTLFFIKFEDEVNINKLGQISQ